MILGFTCSGQTCDIRCWSCPVQNRDQKKTWGKDPEGHTDLGKVYKESSMLSGGSGWDGWIIESYKDLWNEFSTQQVSHGNRHPQCKFCTQTLWHDFQIQTLKSWINPLFTPLTNNENIRNTKSEGWFFFFFLFASWFKGLEYHWHFKSSPFQLWVWEMTLLFKTRMGYLLPYRPPLGSRVAFLHPISMFFLWFLSSDV